MIKKFIKRNPKIINGYYGAWVVTIITDTRTINVKRYSYQSAKNFYDTCEKLNLEALNK